MGTETRFPSRQIDIKQLAKAIHDEVSEKTEKAILTASRAIKDEFHKRNVEQENRHNDALRRLERKMTEQSQIIIALLKSLPTPNVSVTVPQQESPTVNVNVPKQDAPTVNVNVPQQEAPTVNVNVPKQDVPNIDVHVPKQDAPTVNVSVPQQEAPTVNVNVPKAEQPVVNVHVPQQEAPIVNVNTPAPRLIKKRVEYDADAARWDITEEDVPEMTEEVKSE